MCCRGVQRLANAAYLEGFPFSGLLSVAPYCVAGGISMSDGYYSDGGSNGTPSRPSEPQFADMCY
jgi:hypothetical protein